MKLHALQERLPRFFRLAILCLSVLLFSLPPSALARSTAPPYSALKTTQPVATVGQLTLIATDVAAELQADAALGRISPLRFAVPHDVSATPASHGTWEAVNGGRLWRLRVASPGATDMNFGFSSFWLPEGATLHVTAESEYYFQGPYTQEENAAHGQLWTALVPGESAVIEMFVPAGAQSEPRLTLSRVGAGYRDWFGRKDGGGIPKSGDCNIDVVCPQTAGWENEIRSVGVYTLNGVFTCTGTMIGNAQNNFRSFFLTADHCEVNPANAASVVVYWNFQSPTCGALGGGSLAQNQSGAIFRAARADVDFCLLELTGVPSPSFRVYYSGWDRSSSPPPGVVGIHHPNADEKAFSKSTNPVFSGGSCIGISAGTHWLVTWTQGTTEPGSSGSGIWNLATKRLVGMLSGGEASCSNPGGQDCYGKFSVAWNSAPSASERLSDWLDPLNTGVTSIAGSDGPPVLPVSAGCSVAVEGCSPANGAADPGEPVTVNFSIRNMGAKPSTNLVGTLLFGNGIGSRGPSQNYGAIAPGATVSRLFSLVVTSVCGSVISPVMQLQDGAANLGTLTYSLQVGAVSNSTVFAQNFDGFPAPNLPADWTSSATVAAAQWTAVTGTFDTAPNSAFAPNYDGISDSILKSPLIVLNPGNSQISFRHLYNTEAGYDGGVLEVSVNGGAFTDIQAMGGSFAQNGYNDIIADSIYGNPLADRNAWTGNSSGFVTTVANLPAASSSRIIQFQWRLGCDESASEVGWYVDTVRLSGVQTVCCNYAPPLVDSRRAAPSAMAFSFDTAGGKTYVIETATNLPPVWVPLQTNSGTGVRQSVTNAVIPAARRFFRLQAR